MPRRGKRSWPGPRLGAPFCRVSPCGARYFPSDGKVPKGSPGDAADGHFVPIGPPPYPLCRFTTSPPDRGSRPPDPHLRGLPLGVGKTFPARKIRSAWVRFLPGHWALGLWKIGVGAVPLLRLPFPNQRSRFVSCVGATLAVARKPSPLGEGRFPLSEGNG